MRLELTEADSHATASRENAHAREIEIGRLQQQIALDRQQVETLGSAAADIGAEVAALEERREPARLEVEARRESVARATAQRDGAAETCGAEESAYADLQRNIEGLEADVEASRSEVFAAVNAATALRHALEHASSARGRIADELAKLDVEENDLRDRRRSRCPGILGGAGVVRAGSCSDRGTARSSGRRGSRSSQARARSATAGPPSAASGRTIWHRSRLVWPPSKSSTPRGRITAKGRGCCSPPKAESLSSDRWPIISTSSLATSGPSRRASATSCSTSWSRRTTRPSPASRSRRERQVGRVGFLVMEGKPAARPTPATPGGVRRLSQIVRVTGPAAAAIEAELSSTWVADSFEAARWAATQVPGPVATVAGDVFRGGNLVEGGQRAESLGILSTKREIKELREKTDVETLEVERLRQAGAAIAVTIAAAESAIASLQLELHRQEKAAVGFELQIGAANDAAERLSRKGSQIATERRTAEEELRAQESRRDEARESISRIEIDQRSADEQLNQAQRRLFEAREAMQAQSHRTAEAKAAHAGLVERVSALCADLERLEEAGRELESRTKTRREDLLRTETRGRELRDSIGQAEGRLDADLLAFADLKDQVRLADDRARELRAEFEHQETRIRDARRSLETVRGEAAGLEVVRATAETDLAHLATSCIDAVQATLDEVAAEVDQLEREGALASPVAVEDIPDPAEMEGEEPAAAEPKPAALARPMTPDEMVSDLRQKIERMGAVNMMAIDQFDDLESRHTFLTTQRKDLVDSIAATGEAIRRIDKTTRERFKDAFTVINENFAHTFKTLFGGGQAGLVLLDESDQLESGIDIIAQPPGKRLQSVQLLSGGEKALTAMALMFAIFKYRPSPFCLLDEIDAPLDDANIGRFVEMLQGMQDQTQFILITHNRKTMEIADRLYGVTMEEPGVSKLISVQLNWTTPDF